MPAHYLTAAQRERIRRQHAELPRDQSSRVEKGSALALARRWGLSESGLHRIVREAETVKT